MKSTVFACLEQNIHNWASKYFEINLNLNIFFLFKRKIQEHRNRKNVSITHVITIAMKWVIKAPLLNLCG